MYAQGRFREAAARFRNASLADPRSADYVNNHAACLLELGEHAEAIRLANRALELNPRHSYALVNRADALRQSGRVPEAAADYRRALELDPRNPVVLNKAGACMRLLENLDEAEALFNRALELAPGFSLAKLNLGLLNISRARGGDGERHVREALRDRRIDPESRKAAAAALAILEEHRRLQPALDESVESGRPEALDRHLRGAPAMLLAPDSGSTRMLERLAAACSELEPAPMDCRYDADTRHLPFLEAWSNCNGKPDHVVMADALRSLQDEGGPGRHGSDRDLSGYREAISLRRRRPLDGELETRGESWLRYWHALLLRSEEQAFPGQFKLVPNLAGRHLRTVPPENVQGTVKALLEEFRPGVPAGMGRALFMKIAIVGLHAFKDGNGRLARFLYNWELESQGMDPSMLIPACKRELAAGMDIAMERAEIRPACEAMLRMHRETATALEAFNQFMSRRRRPSPAE